MRRKPNMDGKPEWHEAGRGPVLDGALMAMAVRLASHARQLGLKVVRISRSKYGHSKSCYLRVRDDLHHVWLLRISDHPMTGRYDYPHFSLLSRDGISGEQWLVDSLAIIAGGGKAWFDTTGSGTPARQPRRFKRPPAKPRYRLQNGERM